MKTILRQVTGIASIIIGSTAFAGDVTIPNTFTSGTKAVASEVNANFSAVETEVDDNAADIATNAGDVATNTGNIATNASNISNNSSNISSNATAINTKQNLVTGTCPTGQSIRAIAANGTVTCEADDVGSGDITAVNTGSGLTGGGITGSLTLSVPTSGITATHIATDAVGAAELANNAVSSANVVDNSLTASDLAADSVGSSELANNAVGSANVVDNSLTASDLAAGSVGTSEVADNSLTANDLATGSVGTSEIANGSITDTDIADEPGIEYALKNATQINTLSVCSTSLTDIRTVTLTAPATGYVVAMATGTADGMTANQYIRVVIDNASGGSTYDSSFYHIYETADTSYQGYKNFSMQNAYSVAAGDNTFYLKACRESTSATGGYIDTDQFIVMYFPTRY